MDDFSVLQGDVDPGPLDQSFWCATRFGGKDGITTEALNDSVEIRIGGGSARYGGRLVRMDDWQETRRLAYNLLAHSDRLLARRLRVND